MAPHRAPTPAEYDLLARALREGGLVHYQWDSRSDGAYGWTTDALRRATPHGERPAWRAGHHALERAKARGWVASAGNGDRAYVTDRGREALAAHQATATAPR